MILSIASGKGGTGKTTVSLNLAKTYASDVCLLDCDVEEPNNHLFLKGKLLQQEIITILVPQIDAALCDACGECSRFCAYNALVSFGAKPLFYPEMCHGCGGCAKICPQGAIKEVEHRIGVVETLQADKIKLIQGRLDVGMAMAPPLIDAVKSRLDKNKLAVLDAPPGTSCPVVATLRETDFTLLVTEPTPFGLHDLKLAVSMTRALGVPFGIVINRAGAGDDRVHVFCEKERLPVLLEIPDDRRIAEAYSRGVLMVDAFPAYRELFLGLMEKITNLKQYKILRQVR